MAHLTTLQFQNCKTLIISAFESNYSRQLLVKEIMNELKCSGMMAGDVIDKIIYAGMVGNSMDSKYFDAYHPNGVNFYTFGLISK